MPQSHPGIALPAVLRFSAPWLLLQLTSALQRQLQLTSARQLPLRPASASQLELELSPQHRNFGCNSCCTPLQSASAPQRQMQPPSRHGSSRRDLPRRAAASAATPTTTLDSALQLRLRPPPRHGNSCRAPLHLLQLRLQPASARQLLPRPTSSAAASTATHLGTATPAATRLGTATPTATLPRHSFGTAFPPPQAHRQANGQTAGRANGQLPRLAAEHPDEIPH